MWRYWRLIDPRRAIVAVGVFLGGLAFTIHLVLLSSDKYNWVDPKPMGKPAAAATK